KCAVKKYAGDDPDVTDGILVYAEVRLTENKGIMIDGGEGVGRVTKAGLWQNIGEVAINKVPRQMIEKEICDAFELYNYNGGAQVIISVPGGEAIAEKTFNPRLGIVGGISILGTSGIVEPMSEKAIVDTINAEMKVKKANEGNILLMTPGNYGTGFINDTYGIDIDKALKCSNFIGLSLDMAAENGFEAVLLVGHIGKLVKLAGGIMDTHSKNADCRMEILAANTLRHTENIDILRKIADCATTDAALEILNEYQLLEKVMDDVTQKALFYMKKRVKEKLEVGIVIFSNELGLLGESENTGALIRKIRGELL
ncbi:MAG: cobalt-precorrin-5B (C(1))-methyltransferase CbiD, partial [Clostridiales bacterium]|nr:cobalt-precorrin-5B (C(1))-methyltransferase CbiD [Clostridiales bacterium]